MNPWKACDIRGIFPDEVSPDLLRRVGAGVASTLPLHARILIAGDFRESTPVLKAALAEGLLAAGAHVVDARQLPTPVQPAAHSHRIGRVAPAHGSRRLSQIIGRCRNY